MHGGQELPRLVVEGVGDPLYLRLQRLVQVEERLLGTLAIGDVARDPQDAHDAPALSLGRRDELAGDEGAGHGADAQLERRRRLAMQDRLEERGRAWEVIGMDEAHEILAQPLRAGP